MVRHVPGYMAPRYGRIRYGARQGSKGLGRKQGVGRQGRWACRYLIPTLIRIAVVTRVSRCGLSRRLIRSSSSASFSSSAVLPFFFLLPSSAFPSFPIPCPVPFPLPALVAFSRRAEPKPTTNRPHHYHFHRPNISIKPSTGQPTKPPRTHPHTRSRPSRTRFPPPGAQRAQAPSNYLGRSKEARRGRKRGPRRSLSAGVGVGQRVRRRSVCSSVSSFRRSTSLVPAGASRCL